MAVDSNYVNINIFKKDHFVCLDSRSMDGSDSPKPHL